MSLMTARLSTALTMSTTVRPATATAVRASISTPVRSVVRTVAVMSTPSSATSRSTVTDDRASGWHRGIRAGVCLAPMIPARRATARVSPLGSPAPRSRSTTSAETRTRPAATASRAVASLPETSTMRAAPDSSTWVSLSAMGLLEVLVERQHGHCLTGLDRGHGLVHHDQGVGLRQVADHVRALGADRRHGQPPLDHREDAARVLPPTARRGECVGEDGVRRRPEVRRTAHHPAQRREDELLEGDVRRHRVARQGDDRDLVLADRAEALRLAGLHRDATEPDRPERGQRLLDHV